jgi:hypothetical protein
MQKIYGILVNDTDFDRHDKTNREKFYEINGRGNLNENGTSKNEFIKSISENVGIYRKYLCKSGNATPGDGQNQNNGIVKKSF